jgi:hypothetical protein
MSQGLLSEGRKHLEETVTDTPIIKTEPFIIKKEPVVIDLPRLPEPEPNPTLTIPLPTGDMKEKNCRLCSAHDIANLAFRISLVVFVIALSISVLKSGGPKNV